MENLEHEGCGGRGEVESLSGVGLWVVFGQVAFDDDCFCGALLSNQKHGLVDISKEGKKEELCLIVIQLFLIIIHHCVL